MDHYIYCADVYCQECGDDIKARIKREGGPREHSDPDESWPCDDSEEWPQGPYSNEESDSPQHCGSGPDCLNPYVLKDGSKVGAFLEEPLTLRGEEEVRRMHRDSPSEITAMWMEFYGLHRHCEWCDGILEDHETGKLCAGCQQGN